jgi:hypothetical protein
LSATTIVEADISAAPMAGLYVNPAQASTPAASGMAITLYPAAQARFWIILRYDARDSRMTPVTPRGSDDAARVGARRSPAQSPRELRPENRRPALQLSGTARLPLAGSREWAPAMRTRDRG